PPPTRPATTKRRPPRPIPPRTPSSPRPAGPAEMELKPEQLVAQLDSGLQPAYLIAGPEPLRVLEAADAVRAAARAQGIAEREVFDTEGSREPDWDAMQASFRAPSLVASRRLIEPRLPLCHTRHASSAVL